MMFAEEDSPHLKAWIVKRLENTSDADADVLAEYVLALLRHDGDTEDIRSMCMRDLPDFLKEDSAIFIRDVFEALRYKVYLPGNASVRRPSHPFAPPAGPSVSYGNLGLSTGLSSGSRKRSYNDRGDGDIQDRGFPQAAPDINVRAFKQPRRGVNTGRGGFDSFIGNGREGYAGRPPPPINLHNISPQSSFPNMPPISSPPAGMPPIDPNNPLATLLAMQAMGFSLPEMPNFPHRSPGGFKGPSPASGPPRKPRCRDYDLKGYCARGNTCQFEHGQDSIFVPPGNKSDEYDPSTSLMFGMEGNNVMNPGQNNFRGSDRGRGRGRGQIDRGGLNNTSRRGGRAEFSSDRPNYDKSNATIVVENIPEERFTEDAVREFFSEFGTIIEVSMRPYKRLAIVKFEDWNGAKAAYASPKVIFDNRFVKVYWYTNPDSLPQPPAVSGSNGAAGNGSLTPAPAKGPPEPQIDIEEFSRKQQEVQKAHEEKVKKKQEMEAARKELEKRQEDLLKSQAEEKRKLMERIAAKSKKAGSPDQGSKPDGAASKQTAQTEALKKQLAALEAEAQSLGLDTSLSGDTSYSSRGGRGGRGFIRGGRGGRYPPRGSSGFGVRGGFARGGTYKLDNRPKKVALTGIDFTHPEKDEALRQYLLVIGEFTDLDITPERTSITFKDRFTAEKFMFGGEIPSIGKVDFAWVQTPLPPVNLASKAVGGKNEDDSPMDEGDAMAESSSSHNHAAHSQEQQENIDYDVADDNDWGVQ
ncbi:hypothetical protein B7494_g1407 [Chlorociboria aeruginascens]|nr:hypothetical protein B7494_g1407 [Chlorociboria aeruginascens]